MHAALLYKRLSRPASEAVYFVASSLWWSMRMGTKVIVSHLD